VTEAWRRWSRRVGWAVIALPGLIQLVMVASAVSARFGFPYDLEWNEGGMLLHADRLLHGGLYTPPSIDFIAFPYTPLYPASVAALGAVFGVSYQVARAISVLAMIAVGASAVIAIRLDTHARDSTVGWVGAALGVGAIAAGYPFCEGWYDIAKPDMLMVAVVIGGTVALRVGARRFDGWRGHGAIAVAAATLALGFFVKQTAVIFVAAGGAAVVVSNWRRLPAYVASAGVVGLGGTWLLDRATGGWFWRYIYQVKSDQDFNVPRFWGSFGYILWQAPAHHQAPTPLTLATVVIALGLVAVGASAALQRRLPRSSAGFLLWTWMFAVACVAGAIGWAAPWGHFNHYIPAMAMGGIAAGSALPAIAGALGTAPRAPAYLGAVAAASAGLGLAVQLGYHATRWRPAAYAPTAQDRQAGDCLVRSLRAVDGDVLMPFHPWYPRLAGKRTFAHRMGILDMRHPHQIPVAGLREAIAEQRFAVIVLNHNGGDHKRGVMGELPGLERYYHEVGEIPSALRPRVYTGARTMPRSIFVPKAATGAPLLEALAACARVSEP
jgi:hypothetical protein